MDSVTSSASDKDRQGHRSSTLGGPPPPRGGGPRFSHVEEKKERGPKRARGAGRGGMRLAEDRFFRCYILYLFICLISFYF